MKACDQLSRANHTLLVNWLGLAVAFAATAAAFLATTALAAALLSTATLLAATLLAAALLASAAALFTTTTLIALTIVCHNPPLFDLKSIMLSLAALIQDIVAACCDSEQRKCHAVIMNAADWEAEIQHLAPLRFLSPS